MPLIPEAQSPIAKILDIVVYSNSSVKTFPLSVSFIPIFSSFNETALDSLPMATRIVS